jgi:hypothetical protein
MTMKSLPLDKELKRALRVHAFNTDTPMGAIVGGIITDIGTGVVDVDIDLAPRLDEELKYVAPGEYEAALERARAAGVPLAEVIRRELAKRVAA